MYKSKVHSPLLSINVNKIATLRNSRGGDVPNVVQTVKDLVNWGAKGITVHPRPDERHITRQDVFDLKKTLASKKVEFNIEGYPSKTFIKLVLKIAPHQVTLVPDKPNAITSNAGWDLNKNKSLLKKIVNQLNKKNIRVSLFIDVFKWNKKEMTALKFINPQRIELYTEKFAQDFDTKNRSKTTACYSRVAKQIHESGYGINAGHDLNSKNLRFFVNQVPETLECSIGHAFIADSLYWGMKKTFRIYNHSLKSTKK